MHRSSQNLRPNDDHWRSAFEILQRCQHLTLADRREFAQSVTNDPAILEVLDEILENASSTDQSIPEASAGLKAGDQIGRYQIQYKLGAGGVGHVYSAQDMELGREVALKFLSNEVSGSQSAVDKLLREARAASALHHRSIVTVYEVIRDGSRTAIAMEQLDGDSLRSLCGKPLPLPRLIHFGEQIADALAEAHRKGIVHRDIKPENVMVDSHDYVKIVDFGVARRMAVDAATNDYNAGTINYFSPEQARGELATSASDIFALGIVLYELATGVHPFRRDRAFETLYGIVNQEPVAPSARNPSIPVGLNRLILDMLNKSAALRPAADDIAVRLSNLSGGDKSSKRRRVNVLTISILVAITALLLWKGRPQTPPLTLRELTSADSENRVTAAAIAPDGSQLAYADVTGAMFIRSIENKRTRLLSHPPPIVVEKIAWFPDLSALLAVGRPLSEGQSSAWIVRLDDRDAQLLRENIETASLSPDGSRMAFTNADSREIWIADLSPERVYRKLVVGAEHDSFPEVVWSAGGKNLICQRRTQLQHVIRQQSPQYEPQFQRAYESIDAATGAVTYRREDISMRSATVGPDGRVLFVWQDTDAFSTNLWEMKTDPTTGEIREPPRALTQYREMALAGISASRDGKRMVAVHYQYEPDVYLAQLDTRSKKILNRRRVTFDRAHDYPHSFSANGETIFFESNRNGTFDIFRQNVEQRHAEFVAGGPERDEFNPIVTPDGKWVLYASVKASDRKDRVLERVPVEGGEPVIVPIGGKLDYFDCSLPRRDRCVLRTTENQEYAFYDLDPVKGKGRELTRVPWSPDLMGDWGLSADGSEVAIPNHDVADRSIHVVPLDSSKERDHVVRLKGGAGMLSSVRYSADGLGWFVVMRQGDEFFRTSPLLKVDLAYVDRQGTVTPLRDIPITSWAVVSPTGRRLAFADGTITGNAVLLER